jgi:Flp pilus assembly protein TadB
MGMWALKSDTPPIYKGCDSSGFTNQMSQFLFLFIKCPVLFYMDNWEKISLIWLIAALIAQLSFIFFLLGFVVKQICVKDPLHYDM